MRRHLALALALLSLLPLPAAAQAVGDAGTVRLLLLDDLLTTPLAPQGSRANSAHVVPVWVSADGRVAATLAVGGASVSLTPPSPQITSALDWRLVDASALLRSELRVGNGSQQLHAALDLAQQSALSTGAGDFGGAACFGVPQWLGGLRSGCPAETVTTWRGGNVSAGWSAGPVSVDLLYDVGWLDGGRTGLTAATSALGSTVLPLLGGRHGLPALVLPGMLGLADSRAQWGAVGRWELSPSDSLGLGASVGRIRLLPDADGLRGGYNQTALSLGLNHGSLSGNITGRVYSPLQATPGASQRWTGLDLGVTWRTPWQAELSLGAQNLWSTPTPAGEEAEAQARVPYVQYHQDL